MIDDGDPNIPELLLSKDATASVLQLLVLILRKFDNLGGYNLTDKYN
jgi:hypothetical protein